MDCSRPGIPVLHYLLDFAQFISIELMMPSSHLILCHPFLLMPSIFPSISLFLWVSSLNQIAKDGTSTLALVLPADIQGWFPLGLTGLISLQSKTLSRIFSSTSLKALVLWRSAFFYGPTLTSVYDYWKSIALTIRTVVGNVMSLLFNTLSRFLRAFLPRSKNLLLSWVAVTVWSDSGSRESKVSLFPLFTHLFATKW